VTLTNFVNYASLVRTGTGDISIATAHDLVLQSPLSLIYTAGTGYDVDGTTSQPLAGFTQYNGILTVSGPSSSDTLPASTFATHGGNVGLAVGGNIIGAMNAGLTVDSFNEAGAGTDQELPYEMTALGSQLKLQNWILPTDEITVPSNNTTFPALQGGFSGLYASDSWMLGLVNTTKTTYYTLQFANVTSSNVNLLPTPGDYQLAWYTWYPFLENTIGAFGGGNIAVRAGGNITSVQFVSPTNARDAGPMLAGTNYYAAAQTGLYVQGGGNVSVQAGGSINDVYTYVQNGKTLLQAGGSIGCSSACGTNQAVTTPIVLETSTGDVSILAGASIYISDQTVEPDVIANAEPKIILSGISLIQNANALSDISAPVNKDKTVARESTVLTGLLTSVPTGTLTLEAIGDVTLDVARPAASNLGAPWNTIQGILPPSVNLISFEGNVINQGNFTTYPAPTGTVNLLAQGSVVLDEGFVLSDASPSVMPTIANIAALLAPYNQMVTDTNAATETLLPSYSQIGQGTFNGITLFGGPNYLPGQDPNYFVLGGDVPDQLNRDLRSLPVSPQAEAERHAGLHAGDSNPARIIALTGDVSQDGVTEANSSQQPAPAFVSPYEDITKATEIFAGEDIVDLALIGQNNNVSDVTSITAGRDIIWPLATSTYTVPFAIEVGGPGNVVVMSGRNVDLGSSAGIQTIGNVLDPALPATTPGASITIETGLGSVLTQPAYANFISQYVNPATASSNQFAEPLQLFDASGNPIGSSAEAYAYLQSLPPVVQDVLLNRIFFALVRDSGREHTGAAGGGNYELGFGGNTIDAAGVLNPAFTNYQRAFAVIGTFLSTVSPSPYTSGSFLGGLSTVRTRAGGNITILAPNGQIEVGLVSPPSFFPGYSSPTDPTYALGFGVVTEEGGDVSLYANGDISVDQSRVFTLEGGDITAISRTGNIDAGKGAKTVQVIQPPYVAYDVYGNISITAFGPASGSGIQVLRALPNAPISLADLIAFQGVVNADDAGISVSGNLNIAAVAVLNASNIQVGGIATGIPVVQAPNIGALTSASTAAGAATKSVEMPNGSNDNTGQSSIIIVEVLGYGGGDDNDTQDQDDEQDKKKHKSENDRNYDRNSAVQVVGYGGLTNKEVRTLSEEERQKLSH
jgi:filamentous hemagglutinin